MFAGVYYSMQRLLKARMFSDTLSWIHFWGWQLIILAAAITLPLGFTTSKEYAELEWPIDIAITIIWVVFGWNMIGTIYKEKGATYVRRDLVLYRHVYHGCCIHLVNSFEIPVTAFKSYSVVCGCSGRVGTMVVWSQCGSVLSHYTLPGHDVLLPAQSSKPAGLFIQAINHTFLVIDLSLYLGRSSSPSLYFSAGLGSIIGCGIFYHADRSILGWNA